MDINENEKEQGNAYDVVVVGGGTAGLSAALILGRSRRSVLVVDAGEPRNAPAAHMQGYLSRDGMDPAEFLEVGRREVAAYGVEVRDDRVTGAERLPGTGRDKDGEFSVTLASGRTVGARKLVVTTGLVDEVPGIAGVAERWGRDVLHCPYCHGWEVRDRAFGVIASPVKGAMQALLVSQWSDHVTLFLHTVDELSDEDWRLLAAAEVTVVTGEVASLAVEDDRLGGVRMTNGQVFPCEVLFVAPVFRPNDGLLRALGADTEDTPFGPFVTVDVTGRTSVPGLWAAGNAVGAAEQVVNAASAGYRAGVTISHDLIFTDLETRAADRAAGVFSAENENAVGRTVVGDRAHGLRM